MQQRFRQQGFREIDVAEGTTLAHTGRSPKRGRVQLLSFLGCKDRFIMEWFGMTGKDACLGYTELCNDLGGNEVPKFSSSESFMVHARGRLQIDQLLQTRTGAEVADWLEQAHQSDNSLEK